ncbi:DUF2190 family protein [Paenirhodobacter populi]|uniref:DUF2190 family protein n=1 Tax=Paenirhodobacter populi TaxID=2306993 RepID=A0A443IVD1_9RHOB|nr:capsid cement protein [Sinirhodobacter populi]RWR12044.1 DUF2190 family protein [Sinirhodobacter populi]
MATNFVQPGHNLTIPAPAAVLSGEPVTAGEIVGIALGDAAIGSPVDVATEGVWELPKVADAIILGEIVFWDATAKLATATATDNIKLGVAVADAAASTATVTIRLSGF